MLAALGCASTPPPVELRATIDEGMLQALLDTLQDGKGPKRVVAAELLGGFGPEAAPLLRTLLTRRDSPADPFVSELIRSLRAEESVLRRIALDQLRLRGPRVEADLWEAIFSSDSDEVATLSAELLARIDGVRAPPSVIVDALRTWSSIPASMRKEDAVVRIAPVREPERRLHVARPEDHFSSVEELNEGSEPVIFFADPKEVEHR